MLANSGSNGVSTTLYESFNAVYTPPAGHEFTGRDGGIIRRFRRHRVSAWGGCSAGHRSSLSHWGTNVTTDTAIQNQLTGVWTVNISVNTPMSLPAYPDGAEWPIAYRAELDTVIVGNQPGANMETITETYKASFQPIA